MVKNNYQTEELSKTTHDRPLKNVNSFISILRSWRNQLQSNTETGIAGVSKIRHVVPGEAQMQGEYSLSKSPKYGVRFGMCSSSEVQIQPREWGKGRIKLDPTRGTRTKPCINCSPLLIFPTSSQLLTQWQPEICLTMPMAVVQY